MKLTKPSRLSVLLALLGMLAGCRSASQADAAYQPGATQSAGRLQPLGEQHAAAFRAAFDEVKDHDRYIVALSPT